MDNYTLLGTTGTDMAYTCSNLSQIMLMPEQLERLRSENTPLLLSHVGSKVKTRENQSYVFKKKSPKVKFCNFD